MAGERNKINELNRIRIVTQHPSMEKDLEFSAYLTSLVQFGASNKYAEMDLVGMVSSGGSLMNVLSLLTTAGMNSAGKAAAFDIPRIFLYRGTEPMKFKIGCAVKLKDRVETDLHAPLMTLAKMAYPTRSEWNMNKILPSQELYTPPDNFDQSEEDINDSIRTDSFFENAESFFRDVGGTLKGVKNQVKAFREFVGQMGLLNVPVNQKVGAVTWLSIGLQNDETMEIKDIIVKGFSVVMPKLIYDRGYPDRLDFSIDIESRRVATVEIFDSLFKTKK